MASKLDIINVALTKLGSTKIMSLTDNKVSADVMGSVYDNARDSLLRAYPFKFAVRRVVLAPEANTPAFGYSNQFILPSKCERVLDVAGILDFTVENNRILCDATNSINLRYITNDVSEGEMDAHFTRLLSLQCALDAHARLSDSNTRKQLLDAEFEKTLYQAQVSSSLEEPKGDAYETGWEDSRVV